MNLSVELKAGAIAGVVSALMTVFVMWAIDRIDTWLYERRHPNA